MKYNFFTIPVCDPRQAEHQLNSFISQHRIVQVEKQLIADGSNSFWVFCVESVEHAGPLTPASTTQKSKIDYKKVLSEEDFAIYAELRNLRKEIAEREGIPPYGVFTNEQLADIVRLRISSLSDLQELKGVGKSRADKFGKLFLAEVQHLWASSKGDETSSN